MGVNGWLRNQQKATKRTKVLADGQHFVPFVAFCENLFGPFVPLCGK